MFIANFLQFSNEVNEELDIPTARLIDVLAERPDGRVIPTALAAWKADLVIIRNDQPIEMEQVLETWPTLRAALTPFRVFKFEPREDQPWSKHGLVLRPGLPNLAVPIHPTRVYREVDVPYETGTGPLVVNESLRFQVEFEAGKVMKRSLWKPHARGDKHFHSMLYATGTPKAQVPEDVVQFMAKFGFPTFAESQTGNSARFSRPMVTAVTGDVSFELTKAILQEARASLELEPTAPAPARDLPGTVTAARADAESVAVANAASRQVW